MATTPTSSRAPRARITSIILAASCIVVAALCVSPPAHAAGTTAPNYTSAPLRYHTGAEVQRCRGWSGDADDAGRFYTVCLFLRDADGNGSGDFAAPALVEYSPTGIVQRIGWLPAEYSFLDNSRENYVALDVGVAPDGSVAYVTTGPNIDNLGQNPHIHPYTKQPLPNGATSGAILRLKRQADGSWLHDTSYKAGPFLIGGNYWSARRLDVDAAGRVYVSTNSLVYELHPATGAVVSAFGGGATTNGAGGAWLEGIDNAQGVAVSADGTKLYVVEQQHHLVQRWLRTGPTDWTRDASFLLGRPSEEADGLCELVTHFQSPYDVGVDAAGDVYVMDTTCNRVQRFTSAGAFVQTVWTFRTSELLELSHGFAVSWQGSVLLPTESVLLTRTDPPTRPDETPAPDPNCSDRRAPRVLGVTVPARATKRAIPVRVRASDDCGVTHVRVLGNRLGRPRWDAGTTTTVSLSGWNGRRTLIVQVRDRQGRVASRRIRAVLALPQPQLRVRRVVRLAGRGCAAGNPLGRVGGAASYLLVDRCARLAGRVLRTRRSGRGITAEVLLPAATARRIYANAVGPVRIWIVTDSRTRVARSVRSRRSVVLVGSLIATRSLREAYAIPVDVIAGR